jgi:hypothetical protein
MASLGDKVGYVKHQFKRRTAGQAASKMSMCHDTGMKMPFTSGRQGCRKSAGGTLWKAGRGCTRDGECDSPHAGGPEH